MVHPHLVPPIASTTRVHFSQRGMTGSTPITTSANRGDAKLLQGLVRKARKNCLVYVILAEGRLILPETQAPQPDYDVHATFRKRGLPASWFCAEGVSSRQPRVTHTRQGAAAASHPSVPAALAISPRRA
jgi:hypothetical protein